MSEVTRPAAASDPNAEIDNAKVEGVRRARPDKDENCVENKRVKTSQKYEDVTLNPAARVPSVEDEYVQNIAQANVAPANIVRLKQDLKGIF